MGAQVEAAFLIIGNEILSGRTQDTNLKSLAERLNTVGIRLAEARVVPDIEAEIIETVRLLSQRYTYVFTSGGIGPTHDDITAGCMATAFDAPLERNGAAVAMLLAHYGDELELTPPRLKMTEIPRGARLIDNPVSGAPGFIIGNVHVMAGVPRIFEAMVDGLLPGLKGGASMISRTVTCDLPESRIAELLGAVQAQFAGVEIGSYPYFRHGKAGVSVVLRSTEDAPLAEATQRVFDGIVAAGGQPMLLAGQERLAEG